MRIKKASKENIDSILALELDRFTTDAWTKEQWVYELEENKFAYILVLMDNDTLVGYIDYWILFEQATIAKMCVSKDYARQGLGDKLLKKALEKIDGEFCVSTSLEVRVSNTPAIRLYEKNKFVTALTKKGYYSDGEDCYYMLRSIGDIYE